jgi:hypothetical protein
MRYCPANAGIDATHEDLGSPNIFTGNGTYNATKKMQYDWRRDYGQRGTVEVGLIGAVSNK